MPGATASCSHAAVPEWIILYVTAAPTEAPRHIHSHTTPTRTAACRLQTMHDLLVHGAASLGLEGFVVVDSRYDFEFAGGRLPGELRRVHHYLKHCQASVDAG